MKRISNRLLLTLLFCTFCFSYKLSAVAEFVATPGTYELLEGKTMQFDARQKKGKIRVDRYAWMIASGTGAELLNADKPQVAFLAPSRITKDTSSFTLELTTYYAKGGKPAQASINIRVHRKTDKLVVRDQSPWVSGNVGLGFGYLWGGWWPYPPVIVIPPPPPGEVWPPEEIPPIAVPLPEDPGFEDWARDNPQIAESYLDDVGRPSNLPVGELEPSLESDPMDLEADLMIEPAPLPEVNLSPEPMPLPAAEFAPETMPIPEPMGFPEPMDMGGFD